MNVLKLIAEASYVVKIIILILVLFSVFSWAIILFKRRMLRSAASQSNKFLTAFRRSKNLDEVNEAAKKYRASPLSSLFQSGFKELSSLTKSNPQGSLTPSKLERLDRALLKAYNAEKIGRASCRERV